jgi:hypothetical protein
LSRDSNVDFAILDAAPALKRGEQHPAVAEAQRFLERYGYLPAGAAQEGVIDAPTAEALVYGVLQLQRKIQSSAT